MNPFIRTFGPSLVVIVCLFGSFLPGDCQAQNYPDRPIRIVIGFAAGGGADLLLRAIQPKVIELLGQQVIVDYKTGVGGNLAMETVARAAVRAEYYIRQYS